MTCGRRSGEGYIAGVDGCRAGWIVVLRPRDVGRPYVARVVASFADVLALPEAPQAIAVDMPIGLPDRTGPGGRLADVEARSRLGGRQSAVFAVPARAAVMEREYRAACAVALLHSDPPRKVAKQTFNIFAKIREVDALMTPELQQRVVECHPEVAFWAMRGAALDEPKKVKSRPYEPGLALRRDLLEQAGFPKCFVCDVPAGAGADDLLDACACAWTAGRYLDGVAMRFPAEPQCDALGLRQEILA
ncbi:MAG: DUF429 domain-containing protein [Hyphomicrobiaceae bacterium]